MTLWPNGTTIKPYVTSSFGPRNLANPNASKYHRGVDMVGFGLVRAVEGGIVKVTGTPSNWKGGGIQVWVQHDGFFSRSLHLASYSVKEGQFVREGDILGVMGRTPNVDLHLHLEISPGTVHYSNSGQIDPVPFLSRRIDGGSGAGGGSESGGSKTPTPIPYEESEMYFLNVTDNVDGNNVPGWAVLNPGSDIGRNNPRTLRSDSKNAQENANSWARAMGKSAHPCSRQDMLNLMQLIRETRGQA